MADWKRNPEATCETCPYVDKGDKAWLCRIGHREVWCPPGKWCGEHPDFRLYPERETVPDNCLLPLPKPPANEVR